MKLLLLCVTLVVLYVHDVSAGGFMDMAGTMGMEVPPPCKEIMEKQLPPRKEAVYAWIKEKCKTVKCKMTFDMYLPKAWPVVENVANAIFADLAKQIGLDLKKLKGSCKTFQKDFDGILWAFVKKVMQTCVYKDGSPGSKLRKENPCTVTEEKMKPTMECVKGEAMPKAMEVAMPKMGEAKKCGNEMLKEYCTKPKAGAMIDRHMKTAMTDGKINAPYNVFKIGEKVFKDCKIHENQDK